MNRKITERYPVKNLKKTVFASFLLSTLFFINFAAFAQSNTVNFFRKPFSAEYEKGIAKSINAGIDTFITKYSKRVIANRDTFWNRQYASPQAYNTSVDPNRQDLRKMIGATDKINNVSLITLGDPDKGTVVGETKGCKIYEVKWTVEGDLASEGLLLVPKEKVKASAVVIPDANELPEAYAGLKSGPQVALHLAEKGVKVLVPVLIDRDNTYSGGHNLYPKRPWINGGPDSAALWSNSTNREWIWRQGFIMGHHIIGMEVQKVLAAVEWLKNNEKGSDQKIGVMGYGEGGLLALYAAALDTKIDAAWVSGYFGPREQLWSEPIDRDIWGLLTEFGDAEIASMVAPRSLVIEAAPVPSVKEPLPPNEHQKNYGFPGELKTPSTAEVKQEVQKLNGFFPKNSSVQPNVTLFTDVNQHGTTKALQAFGSRLNVKNMGSGSMAPSPSITKQEIFDPQERQHRVYDNMVQYIQNMIPTAAKQRYAFFKGDYSSPEAWDKSMESYRKFFYHELIGKIDEKLLPMNPQIRQIYDKPGWKGYEVALNVWPGVYVWGILAVPKDTKPEEKRPAIVMQHGIGGLPTTSLLNEKYHQIFSRLAEKGFVVFAPYNPYQFNIRKAHAIKTNTFSVIIPQYRQILNYLESRKDVDSTRIGMYGKSWGGRTALRIPIVLKDFKVSVCTAYFNKWLNKTVSTEYGHWSYFFEKSLPIYNWNMGNTFTHAEMAEMIAPRPFMVVDGYNDGVAFPEWVASEFEKVKVKYNLMGIGDRAKLDIWDGGHEIDVDHGGIPFLQKYLKPGLYR